MPMLDEPNGRFGRLGQVASALTTFAILAFLLVYVVLDLLLGAPTWFLAGACIPIAVFSVTFGFTVVDDDELESGQSAKDDLKTDEPSIKLLEPRGRFGRFGQVVVTVWTICMLMGVITTIVREAFGLSFDEWDPWAQFTVFLTVCLVTFLFEMTTLGEDDDDGRDRLPEFAPPSDGHNARYHERAQA